MSFGFSVARALSRITSYNVCYTKLLRPAAKKRATAFGSYKNPAVVVKDISEKNMYVTLPQSMIIVITSYSIHYTKLYDNCSYHPSCSSSRMQASHPLFLFRQSLQPVAPGLCFKLLSGKCSHLSPTRIKSLMLLPSHP